jgi:hypothetical protein
MSMSHPMTKTPEPQADPDFLYPAGWPNDDWTRVELFRLANGRMPSYSRFEQITQETLDTFCRKFDAGEISSNTTDLELLRVAISTGTVKLTSEIGR